MPLAITEKLKNISVAAAIWMVVVPRAATWGSVVKRRIMNLARQNTGTQAATITTVLMMQISRQNREASVRSFAPRDWPIKVVAV